MRITRLLSALTLVLGLASAGEARDDQHHYSSRRLAGGNSQCGSQRVRKPWRTMSEVERQTYIDALRQGFSSGLVREFAAIHLEDRGEKQAHHSCAFFTWHRRMLLAFESALRAQDPKFACVTLPYYDVHTAYVAGANRECSNMYECSDILQGLGGRPGQNRRTLVLGGRSATGYEYTGAPYDALCDDNQQCGAVVRNDLMRMPVPSGAGFSAFQNLVVGSSDFKTYLEGIQYGLHNEIHNLMGGVMATFASPEDVFFYSWHSAIDMYLHVYHLCHFGVPLTQEELMTSLRAFTQRSQSCGGVSGIDAASEISMYIKVNGQTMKAGDHPTLGHFFSDVGDRMWNYGDIQRLGDYSYTYELPPVFTHQLLSNTDVCQGMRRRPTPTPSPSSTPAPSNSSNNDTSETSKGVDDSEEGSQEVTAVPTSMPSKKNDTATSSSGDEELENGGETNEVEDQEEENEEEQQTEDSEEEADNGPDVIDQDEEENENGNASGGSAGSQGGASQSGGKGNQNGNGNGNGHAHGEGKGNANGNGNGHGKSKSNGHAHSHGHGHGKDKNQGHNQHKQHDLFPAEHSGIVVQNSSSDGSLDGSSSWSGSGSGANSMVNVSGLVIERGNAGLEGEYWVWLKKTYDGLMERFNGNVSIVAQQLHVAECMTFDQVYGVVDFSEDFVSNFHLTSNRPECGKRVDEVNTGELTVAVHTEEFESETVEFESEEVVEKVVQEFKPLAPSSTPLIDPKYAKKAEATIKEQTGKQDCPMPTPAVTVPVRGHEQCE